MAKIILDYKTLAAVATFSSNEETRYYLKGVLIENSPQGLLMVATDGQRLVVAKPNSGNSYISEPFDNFIMPADAIKRAKVKCGSKEMSFLFIDTEAKTMTTIAHNHDIVHEYLKDQEGILSFIKREGVTMSYAPIDGTFPDWRRVIPVNQYTAPPEGVEPATQYGFNANYLGAFSVFGTVGESHGIALNVSGDNKGPQLINASNDKNEIFGVLMPLRVTTNREAILPAWLGLPKAVKPEADDKAAE